MVWFAKGPPAKPRVLVIEDNERQAELIAQVVRESGLYEVLVAHNGREGLEVLARHERGFDFLTNAITCILLDWQMPEMNGEEFLRTLRMKENRSPFKRHIPVVILTAYDSEELRLLAEDSTIGLSSAYLLKPFNEKELLQVLKRIVIDKEADIMRELLVDQRSRWLQNLSERRFK
jgi:Response regulators consisting of a CheY-like receiver domain and a winged-helix DNA-binding domain